MHCVTLPNILCVVFFYIIKGEPNEQPDGPLPIHLPKDGNFPISRFLQRWISKGIPEGGHGVDVSIVSPPAPSAIWMQLVQKYGDFMATSALGYGTVFGRDLFERREIEELFLIKAKKFNRSKITWIKKNFFSSLISEVCGGKEWCPRTWHFRNSLVVISFGVASVFQLSVRIWV